MAIAFKKILRKNPLNATQTPLYYPHLIQTGKNVTLYDLAYNMKEKSSLSVGDIRSVLSNFIECMRDTLYSGQSVNIENFGIFSLGASCKGVAEKKECTAAMIKKVRINFRPSTTVKPDVNATRAGERMDFYDIENLVMKGKDEGETGGGNTGGGGDGGDVVDPSA